MFKNILGFQAFFTLPSIQQTCPYLLLKKLALNSSLVREGIRFNGSAVRRVSLCFILRFCIRNLSDVYTIYYLSIYLGAPELNSKGMNVPGLEFQCFTSRYNVIEVKTNNWKKFFSSSKSTIFIWPPSVYLDSRPLSAHDE